jgi:hypothetical protein
MTSTINWAKDQPAPQHAIKIIHANFPQVRNLGIYVCRDIKGTNVRSAHAEGRALDIGLRARIPGERFLGDQLFHLLIKNAHQAGIDNIIWNRHIWSVAHGGPRPWGGHYKNGAAKNPHIDHLHVEWTRAGSQLERLQFLEIQISILRQGIEEITKSQQNIA